MQALLHRDLKTYEPLGLWVITETGDPAPIYADDAALAAGRERLGVYTPPVHWPEVAETLASSSPYFIRWGLTDLAEGQTPEGLLEELRLEWAGVSGNTDSSRFRAKARRLRFTRGQAPELAEHVLGTPPVPYEAGQRVSDYTVLLRSPDDQQLAVLVPPGETGKAIDEALAFGLVFQGDRDLHIVLPDGDRKVRGVRSEPYVAATLQRLAFIVTPVRVWTYDDAGALTEHVIPPRVEALEAIKFDKTIPATAYSLGDRAGWVQALTVRLADYDLKAAHTNSSQSWHSDGRQVVKIVRTRAGLRVTAGVDYSAHRTDKIMATVLDLTGPMTPDKERDVLDAVDRAIKDREAGDDAENLEHLLQHRLDTPGGRDALRLGHRLERELAATRPGQRRGYVDLTGVDKRGDIHIVETKLGLFAMLGLQGLDYWMWATAYRDDLADILRSRGHKVAASPRILLDYVVGTPKDDGSSVDHRYLAPVAEALAGDISWRIGTVDGWRGPDLTVNWHRARQAPDEPRRPEPPRFARRLEDHLVTHAPDAGGTTNRVFLNQPEQAVVAPALPAYRQIVGAGMDHKYLNHVRSSQLFAINLFGGLNHDQVTALARQIDPLIVSAEQPVLEFIDPADRLGEATHASRHQTQIDVVIRGHRGDGTTHVLLIEVKLTEDDFGGCSAYDDPRNDRRDLCTTPAPFGGDPTNCFKLRNHDREHRRHYDDYLPTWDAFDAGCPFRTSGYQLMRQVALAGVLTQSGEADQASVVLCAHDDHAVIWRRWRQATRRLHGHQIGLHELPASRVLAEHDPDDAATLARRYRLRGVTPRDAGGPEDVPMTDARALDASDDVQPADMELVRRERDELRQFVGGLSGDDIKSGAWFTTLLAAALDSYTNKVTWQYFAERYPGVPADAVVDQRIKMASRYAAIEGGLTAGAYTATIVATLGTLGGASPYTVPAAVATLMIDVTYLTRLQLRLAYDVAVLYRIPLDLSDPEDLWKLIRVAFTIKSGEVVRGSVLKGVPALVRPLIKRFYSRSTLAAARGLPIVGKYLLQRNVIKIGIPLIGVPLAVLVNRYTTLVTGRHARKVFRNEARIIESASNLSEKTHHPQLTLWVAWLIIMADGKISDDEALLMRHLARLMKERHEVTDARLALVVNVDPADVWQLLEAEQGDLSELVQQAERVASVDGAINVREREVISQLEERCAPRGGE